MINRAIKLLLTIFILFYSLQAKGVEKSYKLKLYIQPYKGTSVFIDDKKQKFRILQRDKSMALLEFNLRKENISKISLINKKRKTFNKEFKESINIAKLNKKLIFLPPAGSLLEYINSYDTGSQPKSVRFIKGNLLVLPLLKDNGVDIVNINNNSSFRLSPPGEYANNQGFVESAYIKKNDELWITQMFKNCIHVFDSSSFEFKKTINTSGIFNKVLLYDKENHRIFVSHWLSREISIIDPDKKIEIKKFPSYGAPRGMSFARDTENLYIAQFGKENDRDTNGKTIIYNLESGKIINEFGIPGSKRHIVYSRTKKLVFISDMKNAQIDVYSPEKKEIIKTIKVFKKPNTICLTNNEKYLVVSCRGPNNPELGYLHKGLVFGRMEIIDINTFKKVESLECGNQPTGLDINNENIIALTDFLDQRVRLFKIAEKE